MYILNVSVCAYLVFPFVYSVFVYHEYTNADIGPWWVESRLNIAPASKQPTNIHFLYISLWRDIPKTYLSSPWDGSVDFS